MKCWNCSKSLKQTELIKTKKPIEMLIDDEGPDVIEHPPEYVWMCKTCRKKLKIDR